MSRQAKPQEPVWLADRQPCAERHTPDPPGYEEWFMWAEWMAQTHNQTQCPECGLWAICPLQPEVEEPG